MSEITLTEFLDQLLQSNLISPIIGLIGGFITACITLVLGLPLAIKLIKEHFDSISFTQAMIIYDLHVKAITAEVEGYIRTFKTDPGLGEIIRDKSIAQDKIIVGIKSIITGNRHNLNLASFKLPKGKTLIRLIEETNPLGENERLIKQIKKRLPKVIKALEKNDYLKIDTEVDIFKQEFSLIIKDRFSNELTKLFPNQN